MSCQRSPEPVYLRWKGLEKAGKGDLYVRSGPGTVRLGEADIEQYVATRFGLPMSGDRNTWSPRVRRHLGPPPRMLLSSQSEPMPILPTPAAFPAAKASFPRLYEPEPCNPSGAAGETVATPRNSTDDRIIQCLARLSEADDDYWAFRRHAARRQAHGLTQYPAMMVPAMQAVLVTVMADVDSRVTRVLDPFAGSGTTLVESMRLGLNYTGQDINPLAVLFCRTKAGPFHIDRLAGAATDVVEGARADRGRRIEAHFPGLDKWFCPQAIIDLSRIRRAIRRVDHTWCRRVLWTGLAETVRLTSNSRTSTFKLHIRNSDDLRSRQVSPLETFATIVSDITTRLHQEATALKASGHLCAAGCYRGDVSIRLGDSAKLIPPAEDGHDLLITSPPYGDNTSTVPYGQYSYLPLQWIDLHDIDEDANDRCLRSTHENRHDQSRWVPETRT